MKGNEVIIVENKENGNVETETYLVVEEGIVEGVF